ncbi:MAG: hypothetical protein GX952_00335 [Firmicutes bacterium]|nr:hypothetical protein [Bacillota bacterium]
MAAHSWRKVALFLIPLLLLKIACPVLAAGLFTDLRGHWAEAKVKDLATAGIISSAENYRPRDPITRADFIKMLVIASGLPQMVSYPAAFSDVQQEHWFYEYVETAAGHGVVKGDPSGKFRPYEGLTREQMASLVVRVLKDDAKADISFLSRFKDRDRISSWAEADLARAVASGLISGTDQGFLLPADVATRDQAAAVIWKLWQQLGSNDQPFEPPADTLGATAESVGLNQLVITFDRPVDKEKAARSTSYQIVPATGFQVQVPITAAQVSNDGCSVTLTTGSLIQGTRYLLTILDLPAAGRSHTLSVYFTAGISTGVSPPIESEAITVLGPTRLKAVFDQDLNPESISAGPLGNFALTYAGTVFSPGIITEVVPLSKREVVLTVPELKVGERYTLRAHDLQTDAGALLPAEAVNFSFTVQEDQRAPRLTGVTCTGPNSLRLTFNKELDPQQAAETSNYYLRETGERPQHILVAGQQVILIFSRQFSPDGVYTLELESVADRWGNQSAPTSHTVTAARDTKPAQVIGLTALSDTILEVLFNKPLLSIGDVSLKRRGRKIDIRRMEQATPGRVLINTYLDYDDMYCLELAGTVDANGNKAPSQRLYYAFTSAVYSGKQAEFPPQVEKVQLANGRYDQLSVTFSQALSVNRAKRTHNYWLTWADDLSREIAIEAVELSDDNCEAILTLAEPLEKGRTYRYFISGLTGADGAKLIPEAGYLVPGAFTDESEFIRSVMPIDPYQLQVEFAQDVRDKLAISNYGLLDEKNNRLVPIVSIDRTDDSNRIILRLGFKLEEDKNYLFSAGNNLTDHAGQRFTTFTTTVRLTDGSVDRFRLREAKGIDNRTIRLVFNRPVQEVRVDLPGYTCRYEYYDSVVLVRTDRSFRPNETIRPEIWARDRGGQILDWQRVRFEFDPDASVAKIVAVAAATSQRIKVEFSAPLDTYSATDERNFWVETDSGAVLRPVKAEYDPVRLLVWLTLPASASLGEERYCLAVDKVKDINGNRLVTEDSYRFYGVDTVPPVVMLPYLINQEGLPVQLLKNEAEITLVGRPGAVKPESFLRVYIDDRLTVVGQAEPDGGFGPLSLGWLQGRHTIRLLVTDPAGNRGECSQAYEF